MSGFPPIPASPFFLDHLLGLLFLVHVLFLNFVLAGPFVASGYLLAARKEGIGRARLIMAAHPVAYTFAINSGVAVLLFVQVILGRQFFTANTILGWAWLALIALLIASFYGSYLFKSYLNRTAANPWRGAALGLAVGILLLLIELTMVTNYFIGASESQWPELLNNPGLVHGRADFLPRVLHFFIGSVAVTGFWMLWIGRFRSRHAAEANRLSKDGMKLAAAATIVQILDGIWFLFEMPPEVWDRMLGGSFISIVWLSGVVSALLMLISLALSILNSAKTIWPKLATGLLLWTLMGMIAGRDLVRVVALGEEFNLKTMPYETQGTAMGLFFLLLLLGIATVVYLVRLMWPKPTPENPPK